jgi:hypothetical protein
MWEVLAKEKHHEGLHQRRECECPEIFSEEERARRFGSKAEKRRSRKEEDKAAERMAEAQQLASSHMHASNAAKWNAGIGGAGNAATSSGEGHYHQNMHPQPHQYQQNEGSVASGTNEPNKQYNPQQSDSRQRSGALPGPAQHVQADAHRYHGYSHPSTPQRTSQTYVPPSRPNTPSPPQATEPTASPLSGAAIPFRYAEAGQLYPVMPYWQQQHGYTWRPGCEQPDTSGLNLPPFPMWPWYNSLSSHFNTSASIHSVNTMLFGFNSESRQQRSRVEVPRPVSPHTVLKSDSESASQTGSNPENLRQKQSKKHRKGETGGLPVIKGAGKFLTPPPTHRLH